MIRRDRSGFAVLYDSGQDNFVSHTMKAEEEKRVQLIEEHKSKAEVPPPHPLRHPRVTVLVPG